MYKDFDGWNNEKKTIEHRPINSKLYFYEREIWWCSAGLNVGVEINGKHKNFERPMIIIKKFNGHMIWVVPMTTKQKDDEYHYKLTGTFLESRVVVSQIKTMSTKRLLRKIGSISDQDFNQIVNKIILFLLR